MKHTQSVDELKRLFDSTAVPDMDVKDRIKQKIAMKTRQREAVHMKKRVGLIVFAGIVMAVTSAFAAITVYELKSEKGDFVYQVTKTTEGPQLANESYRDKLNKVRESLKPGTASAVLVVDKENPENRVSWMQQPLTPTELSVLQAEVGELYTFPEKLEGGFAFTEGLVTHEVIRGDMEQLKQAMVKEATDTKKDVVVKELELSKTIEQAMGAYKGDKGEIYITIDNLEKVKRIGSEAGPNETVEKIKINNKDALYHEQKMEETGKVLRFIEILKEEPTRLMVSIRTTADNVSKQDLVAIAQKLK